LLDRTPRSPVSPLHHRVAISNSRLTALDEAGIAFKWKDYRIKGRDRLRAMKLDAGGSNLQHRARPPIARRFHAPAERSRAEADSQTETLSRARRCPCCCGRMIVSKARAQRAPRDPTGSCSIPAWSPAKKIIVFVPAENNARYPAPEAPRALRSRSSNRNRSRPTKQRPSYARFPPCEAFERRPHNPHDRPQGGGSKTLSKADIG
jgi:hypothetical protein